MAAQFSAVGVDSLPLGVAALTRKQRVWLLEFLRTGNGTEAARLAGYSSPESDGSKVRRHAGVQACLAHAGIQVAKSVDQLIVRASERSRAAHALFLEELNKPEGERSAERLGRYQARADRTDMLLGSLLGKIAGVHVSGDVKHSHQHAGEVALTVPESALPVLAQMRRDVTAAANLGTSRN